MKSAAAMLAGWALSWSALAQGAGPGQYSDIIEREFRSQFQSMPGNVAKSANRLFGSEETVVKKPGSVDDCLKASGGVIDAEMMRCRRGSIETWGVSVTGERRLLESKPYQ